MWTELGLCVRPFLSKWGCCGMPRHVSNAFCGQLLFAVNRRFWMKKSLFLFSTRCRSALSSILSLSALLQNKRMFDYASFRTALTAVLSHISDCWCSLNAVEANCCKRSEKLLSLPSSVWKRNLRHQKDFKGFKRAALQVEDLLLSSSHLTLPQQPFGVCVCVCVCVCFNPIHAAYWANGQWN